MRRNLPILLIAAVLLAACDAGPKAAAPPTAAKASMGDGAAGAPAASPAREYRDYEAARRDEPVRLVAGKPVWTSNRRMSAEENARSHFQRDGAEFGAKTLEDYVDKAHAFTAKPPKGALKIKRANGDLLIYDENTNTFAVVARSGAPRTMFKPRDGADYWARQVVREKEKSARD